MLFSSLLFSAASLGLAAAAAIPEAKLTPVDLESRATCLNTATTRNCWADGFTIATDAESSWPNTGKTVSYTLTLTEQTLSPDGTPRVMKVINGQYPGPTLTANWGDTLKITVINNLPDNGTSFHWHGISQRGTNVMDGANGVTECPIPGNGGSKTYTFVANEFGATWYHSHYSQQYGDGVVGLIIINGPTAANYDVDLGITALTDYFYNDMYTEGLIAGVGAPPKSDNVLINGKNKNVANTTGAYDVTTLTPGKKHLLRLVNTAIDAGFYVSLDSHTFTVVQADFVPIVPYNTTWLFIGIGQRYNVIINANATASNYWFRVRFATGCGGSLNTAIGSIFNYAGVTVANPSSVPAAQTVTTCLDPALVPYVAKPAAAAQFNYNVLGAHNVSALAKNTVTNLAVWGIDGSPINIDWSAPTLSYVANGTTAAIPAALRNFEITVPAGDWFFWVIQNTGGVTHPIHLHGHDFYLLGSAAATTFTSATVAKLNFVNPIRRDVAILPATGYLVLGFPTDNPGAWLMHCHIAWHVGAGLGVQFLERKAEIAGLMDITTVTPQCNAWDAWYNKSPYKKDDSGI